MAKYNTKCPVCNSCMVYRMFENGIYLYCSLCQKYYRKLPGGSLTLVDDTVKIKINGLYKV
jgi:ssDNA-binding Zn-finger/Zn-ribbon topoisomerase 1